MPKVTLVVEDEGVRIEVSQLDQAAAGMPSAAGSIHPAAVDWTRWAKVAACVVTCLAATPASGAPGAAPAAPAAAPPAKPK